MIDWEEIAKIGLSNLESIVDDYRHTEGQPGLQDRTLAYYETALQAVEYMKSRMEGAS